MIERKIVVRIKYILEELPFTLREIVGGYLQYDQIEKLYIHLKIKEPQKPILDLSKNVLEETKRLANTEIIFLENYMSLKDSTIFRDILVGLIKSLSLKKVYLKCHYCNNFFNLDLQYNKKLEEYLMSLYSFSYAPKNDKKTLYINGTSTTGGFNQTFCYCLIEEYKQVHNLNIIERYQQYHLSKYAFGRLFSEKFRIEYIDKNVDHK